MWGFPVAIFLSRVFSVKELLDVQSNLSNLILYFLKSKLNSFMWRMMESVMSHTSIATALLLLTIVRREGWIGSGNVNVRLFGAGRDG